MQPPATYEDANLVLRLYELRREEKLRTARDWFVKSFHVRNMEEFTAKCPPGSQENSNARMVISYWDMVASFLTSGILNENLFFQSGRELLLVWERVRDITPELRVAMKDPQVWNNLEIVAGKYITHLKAIGPDAYPAFSSRVRGA